MAVFRFLCAIFLLVAAIALITDLSGPLTAGEPFSATTLTTQWQEMAPATLQSTQNAVQQGLAPWVWDYLIAPILSVPTFLLFGLFGLWAGYLGRRRHRINIFVN